MNRGNSGDRDLVTSFQERCMAHLSSFLGEWGFQVRFERTSGQSETYFIAKVETNQLKLDLYVYLDEAGFFWNGDWVICEEQDFSNGEELISAIVKRLDDRFSKELGPKASHDAGSGHSGQQGTPF